MKDFEIILKDLEIIDFDKNDKKFQKKPYFYYLNPSFPLGDAIILYYFLKSFNPKRIIEVGCGYSTLFMTKINELFFDNKIEITCIEPYPNAFLDKVNGINLIKKKLQEIELSIFDNL